MNRKKPPNNMPVDKRWKGTEPSVDKRIAKGTLGIHFIQICEFDIEKSTVRLDGEGNWKFTNNVYIHHDLSFEKKVSREIISPKSLSSYSSTHKLLTKGSRNSWKSLMPTIPLSLMLPLCSWRLISRLLHSKALNEESNRGNPTTLSWLWRWQW